MPGHSSKPRRVRRAQGIYTEGGSWIALYRYEGKQRSKVLRGVSNITQAKAARRRLLADLEAKRAAPASTITVKAMADLWLASRRGRVRPRTFETDERYVALIKRYFLKRVQDVEPRDVERFLNALREGKVGASGRPMAERTVGNALKTLKSVLHMAVLDGGLAVNPCERLQPHVRPKQRNRRTPTLLAATQIDTLVAAAAERTPRYAAAIATLAYTGGRVREILALRWKDIDHQEKLIHLSGQLSVNGTDIVAMKTTESERLVALVPKLEPYLAREARMRARRSADTDFVFAADTGTCKPIDYANLRRALAVASKHAKLERVRAHDLRHSFTSNLIPHAALVDVSRAVGHKSIAVTAAVYAHALGTPAEVAARAARAAEAAGLGY